MKLKLTLLSIGLFATLLCVALVVLELTLRWSSLRESDERRDHAEQTWYSPARMRPNYEGSFWDVPFRLNRHGFRDEEDIPVQPSEDEIRVLSLGDSIGFGLGVEAEQHYTSVAQRLLQNAFVDKNLRIINAGGQGYSPSGYYVYLRHEGMDFRPRMAIVEIELCNDLTDEALLSWDVAEGEEFPRRIVGGRYRVAWDGNLLGTHSIGGYAFERTYVYTVLARRVLHLMNRLWPSEPFHSVPGATVYYSLGFDRYVLTQERIDEGWDRLFGALRATRRLLEEDGADFLLMIMPSRYIFQDAGAYTKLARELVAEAEQRALQDGLPFLNMTPVIGLGGGAELFFDFAHLTVEGNRIVGETLAEELHKRNRSLAER